LCLNKDYQVSGEWIKGLAGKPCQVEKVTGTLNTFIIEPFLPHPQESEYYVCINSAREGDWILFTHEGGVEVGDVDAKAMKLLIAVDEEVRRKRTLTSYRALLIVINFSSLQEKLSFLPFSRTYPRPRRTLFVTS
jgi:ATP citrate (pro-S)-lyase